MALLLKVPAHTGGELGPVIRADLVADMQALQDATLHHLGAYNAATVYSINDLITFGGASYLAIQAGAGVAPVAGGNAAWTELAAKGVQGVVGVDGPAGPAGPAGVQGPAGLDTVQTLADRTQTGLDTAATSADAASTAADRIATAGDAISTSSDRIAVEAANASTLIAEANAIAVVTNGAGSIAPTPGGYPLADAGGHIDANWLDTFPAISQALPSSLNIVDAVISLGKNDSDGRAWAKRCQHTSWHKEARSPGAYINVKIGGYNSAALAVADGAVVGDFYYQATTAQFEEVTNAGAGTEASAVTYRAGSAEFPQDVAITAESTRVVIWDITGAQPTMWMVFLGAAMGSNALYAAQFLNGRLCVGGIFGYHDVDFLLDRMYRLTSTAGGWGGKLRLSDRQDNAVSINNLAPGLKIINATANDVAITVLPNAPIDPATGLPVPTIAVATAGGVSVINDDGTVAGSVHVQFSKKVEFSDGLLACLHSLFGAANTGRVYSIGVEAEYTAEGFGGPNGFGQKFTVTPHALGAPYLSSLYPDMSKLVMLSGNQFAFDYLATGGLGVVNVNQVTKASSMVHVETTVFSTGYMVGDTRRCYLANSLTADRSVKAGALTVVGTVPETVNAGGRNVYSGFSAANYLQEASHADFNALGTGEFSIIMSGVKWGAAGTTRFMLSAGDGASAGSIAIRLDGVNKLGFKIHDGATFFGVVAGSAGAFTDAEEHVVEVKRGTFGGIANTLQIVVDGNVVASTVTALTVSSTAGFLRIGERQDATGPWTGGQCACVRISATASTAEQSKFIADQENKLNGGAACLLSSSNSVSALAFDEDTGVLHVGNGTNIDQFVGLQRISSRPVTSGTLKALTASGGQVFEVGTTGGTFNAPAVSIKAELNSTHQKLAKAEQKITPFRFDGDGVTTEFRLDTAKNAIGFKPLSVLLAGAEQDEGSADDYTVTFDGFVYSALFAVAPIAGTGNVKIKAVRY